MAALHHWRDVAIQKSEVISDAWEVTKAYAARLAEWVLFLCMVANIVEILPGVSIPGAISSAVLGVQAVTLDIAGFGLASMSEHAKRCGNLAAARKGSITGYCLIALMLLTLLVVSIGHLWPVTLPAVSIIEKILLLVRVLMTVIYGHVIHGLRASHATQNTTGTPPTNMTQNTTTNATNGGQKPANAPAKNTTRQATQKPPKSRQKRRQDDATKNKIVSYRQRLFLIMKVGPWLPLFDHIKWTRVVSF